MIIERLTQEGLEVVDYKIIADDTNELHKEAMRCIEKLSVDLFITTGGTGVSPRDITAEALEQIIERDLPGVAEAIRSYGQERNPYSMLSRGMAGVRGKSVIISLPGSAGGVEDGMNAIFPAVFHSFAMLKGEGHGAAPSQSSAKNSLQNSANNDVNNDLKKDFKNSLRTSL
jgi:molybdenum cofactor synthesis domain-containing protein